MEERPAESHGPRGGRVAAVDVGSAREASGRVKAWEVRRSIPYGNERGSIQVVREIDNPLASCREVLFTVESDETESAYLASICRQEGGWRWASAEPAVLRWGALQ